MRPLAQARWRYGRAGSASYGGGVAGGFSDLVPGILAGAGSPGEAGAAAGTSGGASGATVAGGAGRVLVYVFKLST